jgi:predicted GNAT superfamily acetyltransferase
MMTDDAIAGRPAGQAAGFSETRASGKSGIAIRHCDTIGDYKKCVELEFLTWGEEITVPTGLFVVAHHTGGQVLGAFDGELLVGFTMAVAGMRGGAPFLHSHMTAVRPEYQDRGVGRALKLFQRTDAIKKGYRSVEWTFDPLELKNGRFNIVRLGAVARRFIPNCYGITDSPLHVGMPTDRLVAEWWIESERVKGILEGALPTVGNGAVRISLPTNIGKVKAEDRAAGERAQTAVRGQFQRFFAEGYVATSLEFGDKTVDYVLEPADAIAGLRMPKSSAHEK